MSVDSSSFAFAPDAVIIVTSMMGLQMLEMLQQRYIGPLFQTYSTLAYPDRFEWDRRTQNALFQFLQMGFNAYLLFFDASCKSDYLYGYSTVAHVGFLVIIAFYLFDSMGLIMHPAASSSNYVWIFHHAVATALLLYNVSYKRYSAFPAATFLIAAAGHIPNDLRWFLTVTNTTNHLALNATLVACFLFTLLTCGLPPPYLLAKCAAQLNVSVTHVVMNNMRPYCLVFFVLFYVPHVYLVFHQLTRMHKNWNKPPNRFRAQKID